MCIEIFSFIHTHTLGYVQGMSDLLSVILSIMENEVDAFWCFVGLMDMIHERFEETQEFMRLRIKQLRTLLKVSDPEFYKYLGKRNSLWGYKIVSFYIHFSNTCVYLKTRLDNDKIMFIISVSIS